jgi:hypothetical protein
MLAPFRSSARQFRGSVSLWDLACDGEDGPELPAVLALDGVAFAACGGVASAVFWTLGLLSLSGRPLLFDPDAIDDEGTNLNRHLTASHADIGQAKVDLASKLLSEAGAMPTPVPGPWSSPRVDLRTAVVTADDDAVRREVQFDMPRQVLSGGTNDDGIYAVSRHDFLNEACLACIARGDLLDTSPVAGAARRIGLAEEDLAPYLATDDPLPAVVLAKTSLSKAERDVLSRVPGCDFIEHVCGTIRLAPSAPAVSAPMLSAAPGVLLAADLVRLSLTDLVPGSVTMTSILTGPHSRWTFTRRKTPGCACTDESYRAHFRRKWGIGA